jgi:hypothetical protein
MRKDDGRTAMMCKPLDPRTAHELYMHPEDKNSLPPVSHTVTKNSLYFILRAKPISSEFKASISALLRMRKFRKSETAGSWFVRMQSSIS